MDVEDRVRERVEEGAAEQAHEPGETDQRHLSRAQLAHQHGLERIAALVFPVIDRDGLDPRRPRARESRRVGAVGDDDGDLGPEPLAGHGIDQRLQVAAAP